MHRSASKHKGNGQANLQGHKQRFSPCRTAVEPMRQKVLQIQPTWTTIFHIDMLCRIVLLLHDRQIPVGLRLLSGLHGDLERQQSVSLLLLLCRNTS